MRIDLTQMKPDESGVVVELQGGQNFLSKIQNLGIRPGKKIAKVSSHFWRGPQTILIDKTQVAIGHGMASKIIIEVER